MNVEFLAVTYPLTAAFVASPKVCIAVAVRRWRYVVSVQSDDATIITYMLWKCQIEYGAISLEERCEPPTHHEPSFSPAIQS